MSKRICKAVEFGLCTGIGYIDNNRQNKYCSDECKDKVFVRNMIKNKISELKSLSGCTLKPARKGRCEKSNECEYYTDCLRIVWNFETGGYTSDCKGFKKKKEVKSNGWNMYGDYTTEYKVY